MQLHFVLCSSQPQEMHGELSHTLSTSVGNRCSEDIPLRKAARVLTRHHQLRGHPCLQFIESVAIGMDGLHTKRHGMVACSHRGSIAFGPLRWNKAERNREPVANSKGAGMNSPSDERSSLRTRGPRHTKLDGPAAHGVFTWVTATLMNLCRAPSARHIHLARNTTPLTSPDHTGSGRPITPRNQSQPPQTTNTATHQSKLATDNKADTTKANRRSYRPSLRPEAKHLSVKIKLLAKPLFKNITDHLPHNKLGGSSTHPSRNPLGPFKNTFVIVPALSNRPVGNIHQSILRDL